MKLRRLASACSLVLVLAALQARAQDTPPAAPPPGAMPHGKPESEKTALEKDMDKIGRSARALRKQVSDSSKNDSSLELVAAIHDAAEAALKETPAKAQDLPEADRARFVADYQAGMKAFIADVEKLQGDLKAGDNPGAAQDFKQLFSDEKKGHKQFRRPEKD